MLSTHLDFFIPFFFVKFCITHLCDKQNWKCCSIKLNVFTRWNVLSHNSFLLIIRNRLFLLFKSTIQPTRTAVRKIFIFCCFYSIFFFLAASYSQFVETYFVLEIAYNIMKSLRGRWRMSDMTSPILRGSVGGLKDRSKTFIIHHDEVSVSMEIHSL